MDKRKAFCCQQRSYMCYFIYKQHYYRLCDSIHYDFLPSTCGILRKTHKEILISSNTTINGSCFAV